MLFFPPPLEPVTLDRSHFGPLTFARFARNNWKHKQNKSWISICVFACAFFAARLRGSRFGVRGSRFEARGSRFEVRGSRFGVRGSRFEVRGSTFDVRGSRFGVRGWRFEVGGWRFEVGARNGGVSKCRNLGCQEQPEAARGARWSKCIEINAFWGRHGARNGGVSKCWNFGGRLGWKSVGRV